MKIEQLAFEQMTAADAEGFLALEKRVAVSKIYNPITTLEDALEEIRDHMLFWIKSGSENVGTIAYQIQPDGSAYISNMSVVPEHRGEGIARKAMEFALEKVRESPRIWLVVHPENEKAISLYTSLGFREEQRIENYYGDGEPRLVLGKQ